MENDQRDNRLILYVYNCFMFAECLESSAWHVMRPAEGAAVGVQSAAAASRELRRLAELDVACPISSQNHPLRFQVTIGIYTYI